jgi:hypothetical protein
MHTIYVYYLAIGLEYVYIAIATHACILSACVPNNIYSLT